MPTVTPAPFRPSTIPALPLLPALAVVALSALGCARGGPAVPRAEAATRGAPEHVGSAVCAGCHAQEAELWRGSHHDLAMQEATDGTVLGDFSGVTATGGGSSARFARRGASFVVRTEGPDGAATEFPVAYTFGVEPLQQYLVELPGGRLQALSFAWDARPADGGGQRWIHLYPDGDVSPGDPLHWTAPSQNWNSSCAECHSTALDKGYRPAEDRFETTFAEIDVACEACHGPGSHHVAWAEGDRGAPASGADPGPADLGLVASLVDPGRDGWIPGPGGGAPRRSTPPPEHGEVQVCARCHSRRTAIVGGAEASRPDLPFLDGHLPALLDDPALYFADGQIRDEVFVWGSFQASAMHRAGVRCSDCHDPHSQRLRAESNALCTGCHTAPRYDTPEHHHHLPESPGASCVECHMPERTYMRVDPRRDHSLRVPRPDLTVKLGTPNACAGCHADRPAGWAAEAVARWAPELAGRPHWGEAIDAGRRGAPGAGAALAAVGADVDLPPIVRASALALLRGAPAGDGGGVAGAVEAALADDSALVRLGAVRGAAALPPAERWRRLLPRLDDRRRAVRVEAARIAASALPGLGRPLEPAESAALELALADFGAAQAANAERPDAHLRLGEVRLHLGDLPAAATAFRAALERDPAFAPAAVNLAEVYRLGGRDAEAGPVLRRALATAPQNPHLHHALGLWHVRQGRLRDALAPLARAAELAPGEVRYRQAHEAAAAAARERVR